MTAQARPWRMPGLIQTHFRDVLLFGLLIGAVAWLISVGEQGLGYHWKWYRMPRYLLRLTEDGWVLGPLLQGLLVTFKISAVSLLLATVFGLTAAILRLSGSYTARLVAKGYVGFIRNTPLLTQIFFMYYVIAPIFGMDAFASAVLALSLFEGAYASEIFRAGIVSIPKGQWEASHSLGLSALDTYRKVIIPQALRRVLPPLTGVAVTLIKDSSLASTIAIYELTQQGNIVASDTFMVFEVWFTVAAVYLAVTLPLSLLASRLGARLRTAEE